MKEKIKLIDNLPFMSVSIDIGIMDYGFDINGIIGMDLLTRIFSHIDLENFHLSGHSEV